MKPEYEAILHLPNHISHKRHPMPIHDRAAQFAPFAALTGYDDCISESSRQTSQRMTRDDDQQLLLNQAMQYLMEAGEGESVTLTVFFPDANKNGGAYRDVSGVLRRIVPEEGFLQLTTGMKIPLSDIYDIYIDMPGTM